MRQSSFVIRNDTRLRLYFLFLCSVQDFLFRFSRLLLHSRIKTIEWDWMVSNHHPADFQSAAQTS